MKRDSSNPKILVATILSMSLLTVMAGAAVTPALNAISAHFADANPLLIQFVVSMPALFIILTNLCFPMLCRVMRTRTIALCGLLLYVVAGSGAFFADNIALLLVLRALLGVSVGMIMTLSTSLLAYYFPPEEQARLMGLAAAMNQMGGYGGALKNLSIGCASSNGKAYIHSAGKMEVLDMANLWTKEYIGNQDGFLESMAAAAQAVVDYFQKKDGIIYINVMNNMSIDCDCVDHPAPVKLEDYGILASTDPVALDQACVDIINNQQVTATNDPTDLLNRIDKQHGVHTIEHAETIGLGSRKYTIVNIDEAE